MSIAHVCMKAAKRAAEATEAAKRRSRGLGTGTKEWRVGLRWRCGIQALGWDKPIVACCATACWFPSQQTTAMLVLLVVRSQWATPRIDRAIINVAGWCSTCSAL